MSARKKDSEITWQDIDVGAVIRTPGNAAEYKTGDWRSDKPTWNKDRCIKCGICALFCPEGCIHHDDKGYFEADFYYCKGCGICARECWTQAITMGPEEQ